MVQPHDILKSIWGYDQFRPRQEEIVRAILDGKDTLALLPTGGGKSICFQVPALCLPGICIVVSPLMALMDDQVRNLQSRGIKAHAITSALGFREIDRLLDNCIYGEVKFLYVSPERLKNELFVTRLKKMNVSFFAIDEAHCISQWGYDFRPAYLEIAAIRELKPNAPVLALTASATPEVVADIQVRLAFKEEHVIATGFSRDNLGYHVVKEENKESRILDIAAKMKGSGIIYCGTRLRTKEMAAQLAKARISSNFYHAGMSYAERNKAFAEWMKNERRIVCATNAFGMGIDKPDVRFVLHADVPANLESYFQEAGRGGRDRQTAHAVLLWRDADIEKLREQIEQKYPPIEVIQRVYSSLSDYLQLAIGAGKDTTHPVDIAELCKRTNLHYAVFYQSLKLLELAGYLTIDESTWMPSRIYFPVSSKDLYSFQIAHSNLDLFIKTILRMYGGTFEQFVPIQEKDIARALKMSELEVIKKIKLLEQNGMVQYEVHTDEPKVTYLQARVNGKYLLLPPEVYTDRKAADIKRSEAMIHYLTTDKCRSILLLSYFGEKDIAECGQCDVCRAKQKKGEMLDVEAPLHNLVEKGISSIEDLINAFPHHMKDEVLTIIQYKLDQGDWISDDEHRIKLG